MKCPECESNLTTHFDLTSGLDHEEYFCDSCGAAWDFRHLIDPTELLRLIDAVMYGEKTDDMTILVENIRQALSGDPEPLEKLAGERL